MELIEQNDVAFIQRINVDDSIDDKDLATAKRLIWSIDRLYKTHSNAVKSDIQILKNAYCLNLKIAKISVAVLEDNPDTPDTALITDITWKYVHARKYSYLTFQLTKDITWIDRSISAGEFLFDFLDKIDSEVFPEKDTQLLYCLENLSNLYYLKYENAYVTHRGMDIEIENLEYADSYAYLALNYLYKAFPEDHDNFKTIYVKLCLFRGRYGDRLAHKYFLHKEKNPNFVNKIYFAQQNCFNYFKSVQEIGVFIDNNDMLGMLYSAYRLAKETLDIFPYDYQKYGLWYNNLLYALEQAKKYSSPAVMREVALVSPDLKYFEKVT